MAQVPYETPLDLSANYQRIGQGLTQIAKAPAVALEGYIKGKNAKEKLKLATNADTRAGNAETRTKELHPLVVRQKEAQVASAELAKNVAVNKDKNLQKVRGYSTELIQTLSPNINKERLGATVNSQDIDGVLNMNRNAQQMADIIAEDLRAVEFMGEEWQTKYAKRAGQSGNLQLYTAPNKQFTEVMQTRRGQLQQSFFEDTWVKEKSQPWLKANAEALKNNTINVKTAMSKILSEEGVPKNGFYAKKVENWIKMVAPTMNEQSAKTAAQNQGQRQVSGDKLKSKKFYQDQANKDLGAFKGFMKDGDVTQGIESMWNHKSNLALSRDEDFLSGNISEAQAREKHGFSEDSKLMAVAKTLSVREPYIFKPLEGDISRNPDLAKNFQKKLQREGWLHYFGDKEDSPEEVFKNAKKLLREADEKGIQGFNLSTGMNDTEPEESSPAEAPPAGRPGNLIPLPEEPKKVQGPRPQPNKVNNATPQGARPTIPPPPTQPQSSINPEKKDELLGATLPNPRRA